MAATPESSRYPDLDVPALIADLRAIGLDTDRIAAFLELTDTEVALAEAGDRSGWARACADPGHEARLYDRFTAMGDTLGQDADRERAEAEMMERMAGLMVSCPPGMTVQGSHRRRTHHGGAGLLGIRAVGAVDGVKHLSDSAALKRGRAGSPRPRRRSASRRRAC